MSRSGKIPKFILFFFAFDLALIFLYLIDWSMGQPFWKLTTFVDIDGESNLPAWYSSIQLLVISIFFFVFAREKFDGRDKGTWFLPVLPLVFVAMSLDEIAQIHEWLGLKSDVLLTGGSRVNTPFHLTGIWMFLFGIPFFVLMLSLFYFLRRFIRERKGILKKYMVGLFIFFGSAAGIEALSNFVSNQGMAYMIMQCLEELGEMAGATFILWATYDLLLSYDIAIRIPPPGK